MKCTKQHHKFHFFRTAQKNTHAHLLASIPASSSHTCKKCQPPPADSWAHHCWHRPCCPPALTVHLSPGKSNSSSSTVGCRAPQTVHLKPAASRASAVSTAFPPLQVVGIDPFIYSIENSFKASMDEHTSGFAMTFHRTTTSDQENALHIPQPHHARSCHQPPRLRLGLLHIPTQDRHSTLTVTHCFH